MSSPSLVVSIVDWLDCQAKSSGKRRRSADGYWRGGSSYLQHGHGAAMSLWSVGCKARYPAVTLESVSSPYGTW